MTTEPTYYRTIADADSYFSDQLYATDWTGASDADKAKALLMASRAVDSLKYKGVKRSLWKALRDAGGDTTKTSDYMLSHTDLTDLQIQAAESLQVHQFPRDGGTDEESWTLTVDANNGTYTLTFDGETTAAINYDDTAATILAAIEALAGVGSGNVTVVVADGGVDGTGPYTIATAGTLAATEYNTLTATDVDLGGGDGVEVLTLNDNIPHAVFYAVCEEAKSLLSGRDAEQEFRNLELTSDGVGSNRVSMDRSGVHPEHSHHMVTSPLSWKYIQRYLDNNNSFRVNRS